MIPRNLSRQLLRLALSTGPVLLVSTGSAQSTWNGTGSDAWNDAANWNPGIPGDGGDIVIGNTTANNLTLDTSKNIGSLTFGDADPLRVAAFVLNTQAANALTINGGVTANGAFEANSAQALTMRGHYIVAGDQEWSVGGSGGVQNPDHGIFVREVASGGENRGSLTLNGNLTKTGTGQLNFAAIDLSGAGNLVIEAGTLKFNAGASQPLVIGGSGNLTMSGSSILSIYKNSGTMNITRDIVMNGTSTIATRNNGVEVASSIAWHGAHTLDVGGGAAFGGDWTGAGSVNKTGAGTLIFTGDASHTGTTTISSGALQIGAGGTSGAIDFGNVVNNATLLLNRSDGFTITGNIAGTGNTSVLAGTVRIAGGDNRLSTGLLNIAADASFDINGLNQEIRGLTGGGNIINDGAGASILTIRPGGSDNSIFSGVLSGNTRLEVVGDKEAPAFSAPRQRLAGTANTFTGGVLIDGGTLLARTDGSLGAVPDAFQADNIILRNNGTLLNEADGNTLTLHQNRGITLGAGGGALVGGFNTNVTVQGVISGDAGNHLTILGNNQTVIFTGDNTYAGNTILDASNSRLQIGNGGTSGTLGTGDVVNNGLLTFNRSDDSSYGGDIANSGTVTKTGAGGLILSGDISGTGNVTKSGSGILTLSGSNSYSGTTTILGGVLAAGSNDAFGTSRIRFDSGTIASSDATPREFTTGQALDFAQSSTFGTTGTGDLKFNDNVNLGNAPKTATIAPGVTVEFAGALSGGTTNAFTKAGDGVLELSGDSSGYTRTSTVVSAGTLLVTGQLGGSGTVSVAAGATLGGDGTITGTVVTADAASVISPGTSPGTITLGGLNVVNGATFDFELGTFSDLIEITGILTAGGTLTFNFSDSGGIAVETAYTLFEFDSQTELDYGDLVAATLPAGLALDASFGDGGWRIESGSLQVQFIPEPSTALLGGLGMLLVFRRRRDRA